MRARELTQERRRLPGRPVRPAGEPHGPRAAHGPRALGADRRPDRRLLRVRRLGRHVCRGDGRPQGASQLGTLLHRRARQRPPSWPVTPSWIRTTGSRVAATRSRSSVCCATCPWTATSRSTDSDAEGVARRLAREEGIFAGFSSGAVAAAALRLLADEHAGGTVAVVLSDSGLKYLSTDLWPAIGDMSGMGDRGRG